MPRSPRSVSARGPYSLTALQRYSACPYQFLMAAIYRLAPLEAPAPLQKMDPLTRGDLFHQMQAAALRRLQSDGLLPLSTDTLPAAQQRLTAAIREVHDREYDRLSPAIDRVWQDEIAAMTQDLRVWLEKLADEGADWTPERFEFAFGLPDMDGRDAHSTPSPALDRRPLQAARLDRHDRAPSQDELPARHRSQDRQEPHAGRQDRGRRRPRAAAGRSTDWR